MAPSFAQHHVTVPGPLDPLTGERQPSHQLAYVEWGDSKEQPVLLCVHGLTRNSRDFDYIARALAPHYRVIALDVVGRGKSDRLKRATDYNYGTYVQDIFSFLKHLEIDQVDWLGTSMGGLIGMMVAASAPHMVHRLVMNDIGPFIPSPTLRRIGKYVSIMPDFESKTRLENHLRTILAPFGITEEEHWQHMIEHSAVLHPDGHFRLAYDPAIAHVFTGEDGTPIGDVDLWPLWEQITCPVLVLRGAESDALLPETARKMQLTGPRAALVEFARIGHAPALMTEEQIKVVKQWLL